jgi:hypothetical protein
MPVILVHSPISDRRNDLMLVRNSALQPGLKELPIPTKSYKSEHLAARELTILQNQASTLQAVAPLADKSLFFSIRLPAYMVVDDCYRYYAREVVREGVALFG